MDVQNLTLLKEEVERIFGRKILIASDCDSLSQDIYQQTQVKLSLNTLRRFFNLIKSRYQVSLFTLDLLARYCGFSSFSDLLNRREQVINNNGDQDKGLLYFLVLLFNDAEIKCINDITYINLIHTTISYLENKPHVIDQLQRKIAKTHNGQIFYFEQAVNIDKLNSFYGEGLYYYLHEKKTVEAQIFGHSLLCFRCWLTMNREDIKIHHNEVLRYHLHQTMSPSVAARYFASQLYFAEAFDIASEPVLIHAREFYSAIKPSKFLYQDFPSFEYILSEALVITNQFEEALFYISEAIKKRTNKVAPHVDLRLFESIYLYQAIALANTGREQKSKDVLELISTKNFYYLSRNFNQILYFSLMQSFRKRKNGEEQLQYLIEQTGFKKLVVRSKKIIEIALQLLIDIEVVGYLNEMF